MVGHAVEDVGGRQPVALELSREILRRHCEISVLLGCAEQGNAVPARPSLGNDENRKKLPEISRLAA